MNIDKKNICHYLIPNLRIPVYRNTISWENSIQSGKYNILLFPMPRILNLTTFSLACQ